MARTLFYSMTVGDCRNMKEIGTGHAQLIVTSPPYLKAIDYNRFSKSNIGNYDGDEYYGMIRDVLKECYRVLSPGRRLCWNVQDIPKKSIIEPLAVRTIPIAEELGFELNNIIIWDKGRCRAPGTPMGTIPYPGSPVVLGNFEWILVFKRPGTVEWSKMYSKKVKDENKMSTAEIAKMIYAVWSFPPNHMDRDAEHPAPFPLELPMRCMRLFTYPGERVLDPFAGSGTTMLGAKRMKRSCWGYELEEKYIPILKKTVGWGNSSISYDLRYHLSYRDSPELTEESIVPKMKGEEDEVVIDKEQKSLFGF